MLSVTWEFDAARNSRKIELKIGILCSFFSADKNRTPECTLKPEHT
jgi:hypothetical protein